MKTETPEVSVIIPAYNAAKFLGRAVESVVAQEEVDWELLIVDNNSTDGTAAIARSISDRYPTKVKLLQESRTGAAAARNRGLFAARADWVQFLDADDVLLPGKLARQLALPDPGDWIVGTVLIQEANGNRKTYLPGSEIWPALLSFTGLGHLDANLFRKSLLLELAGFDPSYQVGEDFDLFFRIAQAKAPRVLDFTPGAVHIHHDDPRLTTTNWRQNCHVRLQLAERMVAYLREADPACSLATTAQRNAALLQGIRRQATYDLPGSETSLRRNFPDGWRQAVFPPDFLPGLRWLYRIFGFSFTERLRVGLRKYLSHQN